MNGRSRRPKAVQVLQGLGTQIKPRLNLRKPSALEAVGSHERQIVIDTLGVVAAEAKKRGISLGLEVCNRYETYLYNTLADGRATIKAIGAQARREIVVVAVHQPVPQAAILHQRNIRPAHFQSRVRVA